MQSDLRLVYNFLGESRRGLDPPSPLHLLAREVFIAYAISSASH